MIKDAASLYHAVKQKTKIHFVLINDMSDVLSNFEIEILQDIIPFLEPRIFIKSCNVKEIQSEVDFTVMITHLLCTH